MTQEPRDRLVVYEYNGENVIVGISDCEPGLYTLSEATRYIKGLKNFWPECDYKILKVDISV